MTQNKDAIGYWRSKFTYWEQDESKDAAAAGRPPREDEALHMVIYCAISEYLEANDFELVNAISEGLGDPQWHYEDHVLAWMRGKEQGGE